MLESLSYAFKLIAERALRPSQAIVPQRVDSVIELELIMMRRLVFLSAVVPALAAGAAAPPSMTEFDVNCSAQGTLPKLRAGFLD